MRSMVNDPWKVGHESVTNIAVRISKEFQNLKSFHMSTCSHVYDTFLL